MRHFTPTQLKEYLEQNGAPPLLLDVREPWEFRVCALGNSQLIPMGQMPAVAPRLDPNRDTVLICHYGIRSRQVAYFLERTGFTRVINLRGGLDSWAREIDPHMQTY